MWGGFSCLCAEWVCSSLLHGYKQWRMLWTIIETMAHSLTDCQPVWVQGGLWMRTVVRGGSTRWGNTRWGSPHLEDALFTPRCCMGLKWLLSACSFLHDHIILHPTLAIELQLSLHNLGFTSMSLKYSHLLFCYSCPTQQDNTDVECMLTTLGGISLL